MVEATWLGHSCWRFVGRASGRTVVVDPFLDENPKAPFRAKDLARADVVCVTHDHFDHVADAAAICKRTGAVLVATYEVATGLEKEHGIEAEAMNHGGWISTRGVGIHMTVAFHTSGRGAPSGFVIELDGARIYHSGDTALFSDMRLIGELLGPLDLACLPIGDRFTMGPRMAAKAVELLRPKKVAPMHFGTWPPIEQDPAAWRERVGGAAEVVITRPGEPFEVGA
jgi:L-ascorbate metabolism protein UlaG (beta-lactamase superfamily)